MTVHHRFTEVEGHQVFYREAGHPDRPTLVLLHGAPASSHMFRHLIPMLADDFHVIAPDHLGFGLSDSPSVDDFDYSFEALTDVTARLLEQLDITRYALYVQDYGAPLGWRLALRHPEQITAIVSQNGNAYTDGFVTSFWDPLWAYAAEQNPDTEAPLRYALTQNQIKWQYQHGVADPTVVSPDTWQTDHAALQRPGNVDAQLRLFADYPSNVKIYPDIHAYFRRTQVPLMAIWGRNDEIFAPAGALSFALDLPDAEIHLLDGGHFLLESALDPVSAYLHGFLGRVLPPSTD